MANPQINEGAATKPRAPYPAAQPAVSWLSKLIGVQGPPKSLFSMNQRGELIWVLALRSTTRSRR
jgi:hypothetical protein